MFVAEWSGLAAARRSATFRWLLSHSSDRMLTLNLIVTYLLPPLRGELVNVNQ